MQPTMREMSVLVEARIRPTGKGRGTGRFKHPAASPFLPVDWLHLSGDAYNGSWRELLEFLEELPDVHPVLQVQVKLHHAWQTCKPRRAQRLETKASTAPP